MRYAVVVEHDLETGSYGAYIPDLPGLGVAGESYEDVMQLIQEAVELHLLGLREEGLPIPEPITAVEYVEASPS